MHTTLVLMASFTFNHLSWLLLTLYLCLWYLLRQLPPLITLAACSPRPCPARQLVKKKAGKDVYRDSKALQKLRQAAERAKRTLSSQHQVRGHSLDM